MPCNEFKLMGLCSFDNAVFVLVLIVLVASLVLVIVLVRVS